MSDLIAHGGATVGEIAGVRVQATGKGAERPDLAGYGPDGRERVLIEAKFWAGLTRNQPVAYLKRLPEDEPSALLVVAPAKRRETLWNELNRAVAKSECGIRLTPGSETKEVRSASVAGTQRQLLLTSWRDLLRRMEEKAAADSHTKRNIAQLQGLAVREDDDAFLPLRRDELGPDFPRRMRGLRRLIKDATDRARTKGFVTMKGLQVASQPQGYGRFIRLADRAEPWFGISVDDWAQHEVTPLWLRFLSNETSRKALEPLRRSNPPELFVVGSRRLVVPVELPLGVEYDEVLDAVVERLREIANLFSGS